MSKNSFIDIKGVAQAKFENIYDKAKDAPAGYKIIHEVLSIANLLVDKNISYGSSFDTPINIFSKADPEEQLNIRIDDKLNRIKNGKEYASEDTVLDLVGYLVLLRVLKNER
ncbi:MAG: hypothetical protein ACO295_05115 [Sediminibacterium sp.]